MTVNVEAIPEMLKARDQWVVWRKQKRHGKLTKVPYQALLPGTEAESTNPETWATFDEAIDAATEPSNNLDGIGFVFAADDPLAGVDFDNCLDAEGNLLPWAADYLSRINSYAEVSPSGRGIKVFVVGSVPEGRGRKKLKLGEDGSGAIEVYDRGRYFTVTGLKWKGALSDVADRSAELSTLHAELFPPKAAAPKPARSTTSLSDQEVLDKMFRSKNGREIESLFNGTSSKHASGSEADLALCSHLAWWTGGDFDSVDRLFRQSGLCDAKWTEREDYRERTIQKALEQSSFYDPSYRLPSKNGDPGSALQVVSDNGDVHPPDDPADEERGDPEPDRPRERSDDPHRLARLYLSRACTHPEGLTLRYWSEQWHRWEGLAWRVCPKDEISAEATRAIKVEFDGLAREVGGVSRPVTTKTVGNVLQALKDLALLSMTECERQPFWIGARSPGEDLPEPADVLPAANGLVHLPAFAQGISALMPPTPRFFSPNTLGYPFKVDAGEPEEWTRFLAELWPDDPESIECLQEWFGYLLTPDTRQQKILMLIGPKRSGRGTIGRILRSTVGRSNVAAPTLSSLATPFGLQPLIGKTVAWIGDARLSGRADQATIVERLLSVSGEDAQTVDRKHMTSWTGSLPTRFVLVSNELPRLGDASGALPSRMILLQFTRSFFGQEDTGLTTRLLAEQSAILRWAIKGWARLRTRGHFFQPESSKDLLEDLDELASPIGAFVAERCWVGAGRRDPIKELFEGWKSYCTEKGRDHPGDEQGFGRQLRAAVPGIKVRRRGSDGQRVREYEGIELKVAF